MAYNKLIDLNLLNDFLTKIKNLFATKDVATQNTNGLLSAEDKIKIDNLEQAKTSTTVGPAPIVTFDASVAGIPLKQVVVNIEPMQAGSGVPSPENVRPISGWTECNITRVGKNLFDGIVESGYLDINTGEPSENANRYRSTNFIRVLPNTQYSIKISDAASLKGASIRIYYYGKNKEFISSPIGYNNNYNITTPPTCAYIKFFVNQSLANFDNTICILPGENNFTYIPSQGETYNITFPTSAGTVYGGTLDVTSGVLTVTIGYVDLGTLNWNYRSNYQMFYAVVDGISKGITKTAICSIYPCVTYGPDSSLWIENDNIMNARYGDDPIVRVKATAYSGDTAAFKAAMSGVQLVYELTTPQTYQLTAQQITTLLGINNIWADCGDVTVTYDAYLGTLKASLDRTNGELDTLRACIAPIEDGATASQAYAAGSYFFRNGQFCTALTAISSGATFTLGTNYQVTTVAAALIALQS